MALLKFLGCHLHYDGVLVDDFVEGALGPPREGDDHVDVFARLASLPNGISGGVSFPVRLQEQGPVTLSQWSVPDRILTLQVAKEGAVGVSRGC